jgi:16S rRNA (cytidine1402-2'-O)-methyltransferase
MGREESFIMYESPHRIVKLLADIVGVDPERRVCVGREMTKIHEEFLVGTAIEIRDILAARPGVKGEIALLVSGARKR